MKWEIKPHSQVDSSILERERDQDDHKLRHFSFPSKSSWKRVETDACVFRFK